MAWLAAAGQYTSKSGAVSAIRAARTGAPRRNHSRNRIRSGGQAYVAIKSPRGELGAHVVSDGGTGPYRVHLRDPSFNHLQMVAAVCEGGQVADLIPAIASIDPVMGGVDR